MRVALIVVAIGRSYLAEYGRIFRRSHEAWARRHGYDFHVLTDYAEKRVSKCHMDARSFQKIALLQLPWTQDYDYLVVADADIVIAADAPPIHEAYLAAASKNGEGERVGIVDESKQATTTNTSYYPSISKQFQIVTDRILNTGVLVIPRGDIRDMLVSWYTSYVQRGFGHPMGFHYEQAAIGYELIRNNAFVELDGCWNRIWCNTESKTCEEAIAIHGAHFLHFVGKGAWNVAADYVAKKFS